jgi:hypothetical protein
LRGTAALPHSARLPDPRLDRQCFIVRDASGQALACVYFEDRGSRDGGPLVTDVDPAAQSRAPYPAGSVASTAAAAATAASYQTSYQQAHAATAATATSATTNCAAAAPAAAYVAAAHMAAAAATAMASAASTAAAPSATSPCKPYAGAKFSFFVENVKGPQAHIKHFLLGEKNSLPRILGRNVYCRRVCRCAARHRQRDPHTGKAVFERFRLKPCFAFAIAEPLYQNSTDELAAHFVHTSA